MYLRIALIVLLLLSVTGLTAAVPAADTVSGLPQALESQPVFLVNRGNDSSFASPSFDDSSWRTLALVSEKDSSAAADEAAWYRLHLRFPAEPFPFSL